MASFYELKNTCAEFSIAGCDRTLRRLEENLRGMQRRWPRKVDFANLLPASPIAIFPLFFSEAFGAIDEECLVHFLSGCKLLASTIMLADSLFDGELERDEQQSRLLRSYGIQFELTRELGRIFPAESPFWPALQEALAEYLGCVASEWTYASRRRRLCDMTQPECVSMALAKNCVARVAIVGLSLLGSDASRAGALLHSLEKYNFARQVWDDVQDWKADIHANLPTLVTVRLAAALGLDDIPPAEFDLAAMARELYYGGHIDELLVAAHASLAAGLEAADPQQRLPWHALLEGLDRSVAALQGDLRKIVHRNLDRQSRSAVSA